MESVDYDADSCQSGSLVNTPPCENSADPGRGSET